MTTPAGRQFSILTALAIPLLAGLFLAGWRFCETHPVESYWAAVSALGILAAMAALAHGGWRIVPAMMVRFLAAMAILIAPLVHAGLGLIEFDSKVVVFIATQCTPIAAFSGAMFQLVRPHDADNRRKAIPWMILLIAAFLCGSYGYSLVVYIQAAIHSSSLTHPPESATIPLRRQVWD